MKNIAYCKDCKWFEAITQEGTSTSFCNNEVEHRAIVSPYSYECETFEPYDLKEVFWSWMKENTNFYLARKHHKEDIEGGIDHILSMETKG